MQGKDVGEWVAVWEMRGGEGGDGMVGTHVQRWSGPNSLTKKEL